MASTVTGAALAIGQGAASASVVGSITNENALGAPAFIGQNFGSTAGAGYTFTIGNWVPGETYTLTVGPANGQLTQGDSTAGGNANAVGDGNCLTQMAPIFPANTSLGYFGVNQTDDNRGNFVGFSAEDGDTATNDGTGSSSIINFVSGGGLVPMATVTTANEIPCSESSDLDGFGNNLVGGPSFQDLVITIIGSYNGTTTEPGVPGLGAVAQAYLGFNTTFTFGPKVPLNFDVSFGAKVGATQAAAVFTPSGCATPIGAPGSCEAAVPISSNVSVFGEDPTDAHALNVLRNTDPAIAGTATPGGNINGGMQVNVGSPVSNFVINDFGSFLPPPDATANPLNADPIVSPADAGGAAENANVGAVCLVIDNATHNNLAWDSITSWTVAPGESSSGSNGAVGPFKPLGVGTQILELPVAESSGFGSNSIWTASGLSVGTIAGDHTHADGPVWGAAFWAQDAYTDNAGTPTTQTNTSNACEAEAGAEGLIAASDSSVQPALNGTERHDPYQLGYVQLTTVTELADSVFGATTDATAAQTLEHQFDYAKGECVGSAYPNFINGGVVFLGRDDTYPDVLGADYPAGADDTGVLLTPPNSLDQNALNAIRLEGVSTVYLLGGTSAQSTANFTQLAQTPSYLCGGVQPRINLLGQPIDLNVIRIGGTTTQDTNELLAEFVGAEPITPTPGAVGAFANPALFNDTGSGASAQPSAAQIAGLENTAILVTDAGFQDAASASAVAYAWPMPLIVTDPCSLTPQALASLYNDDIDQVLLLGGTGAICDGVVTALGNYGFAVLRIAGMDGPDTSTQFAAFTLAAGVQPLGGTLHPVGLAAVNADFHWDRFTARTAGQISFPDNNIVGHVVLVARGDFYADAIAGGAELAVHNGLFSPKPGSLFTDAEEETISPLILTLNPSTADPAVITFLNEAGLAISGLAGETANIGDNLAWNGSFIPSSSVYVIQPIGGPVALTPALLQTLIQAVG